MRWLLYGAYGYTGRLIAERAVERGHRPVLAGRRRRRVEAIGERLGLPYRAFGLDEPGALRRGLEDVDLVVHAAGPFSRTAEPMQEACIGTGCHYLDITGEVPVFEHAFGLDGRAREAGVLLLPGVGFDVVPTDCAAVRAAGRVGGASRLEIAFVSGTGPSPGTLKTQIEGVSRPSLIRRQGALVEVPQGSIVREVPFSDRTRTAICIPWGDLSTAYRSTGIPNIRTYMAAPAWLGGVARAATPLLRLGLLRRGIELFVDAFFRGPDPDDRREARSRIWVRAAGGTGEPAVVEYVLPGGYTFTARSAVAAVEWIREGRTREEPSGTTTPGLLFGEDFVDGIDGAGRVTP